MNHKGVPMSFDKEWEKFVAKYPVMGKSAKVEFTTYALKALLRKFHEAGERKEKASGLFDDLFGTRR